jgi:hypothetical protein
MKLDLVVFIEECSDDVGSGVCTHRPSLSLFC